MNHVKVKHLKSKLAMKTLAQLTVYGTNLEIGAIVLRNAEEEQKQE